MSTLRKSWSSSFIQSASLQSVLDALMETIGCSALCLPDGTALHVRAAEPVDITTLPQAAALCHGYLHLKDGDVALTNDPYTGGTTLADFTLVSGVTLETSGGSAEVLLARRVSFPRRFSMLNKLDEEGVRVPPMPIAPGGKINTDILTAISAHPLAPRDLLPSLSQAIRELLDCGRVLKALAKEPGTEMGKTSWKRFLSDCERSFEQLAHRLPLGTVNVTDRLPTGELVKLQLRVTEDVVHFDFGGSDNSTTVALTELATFGACVAATISLFDLPVALNSSVMARFQVSAPARTLFSSQAPLGTTRGMTMGAAMIAQLVLSAFAKLDANLRASRSAGSPGLFQIKFGDGRIYSDSIQPGTMSRKLKPGVAALALWAPPPAPRCMERSERDFPIRFLGAGVRAASGGKGEQLGGDGEMLTLKVLEPCEMQWTFGAMTQKQEGAEGGRVGYGAQIDILKAGSGSRLVLESNEGTARLEAGDSVTFLACGAGGYGAPASDEEEE